MSSNCLKNELADHIYQYLCHEAKYSDLPEAARESLTAASECIEQAYKLNLNNNINSGGNPLSSSNKQQQAADCVGSRTSILPDELLRIFTRHKEFLLSQQKDSLNYSARNNSNSTQQDTSESSLSNTNDPKHPNHHLHHHHHHHNLHHNHNHHHLHQQQQQQPDVRVNSNPLPTTTNSSGNHHQASAATSSTSPTTGTVPTASGTAGKSNAQGNTKEGDAAGTSAPKKRRHLIPGSRYRHRHHNHSSSIGVSVHQKNFKQKLIALIKKFRTDGSNFDSEEQYREALERELMKAAAGRGSRAIEELLEEDIEDEGQSGPSEPEDDWDNISESSAPKPSLRPFFSSTTLDKI